MAADRLLTLLEEFQSGYGLAGAFYDDPDVWKADVEVMAPLWNLVGHESQIPQRGDAKVISLFGESFVVVRGDDGVVRGFDNVCPHRGAHLCDADQQQLRRFTCPYHAWSYGLDGSLKSALNQHTFDDFDPEDYRLRARPVRTFHGLIFLSMSNTPTDFDAGHEAFGPVFDLYGLANAKVAHVEDLHVRANWKTLVENTIDQYHVPVVHKNFPKNRSAAFWRAAASTSSGEVDATSEADVEYQREVDAWLSTLEYAPELTGLLVADTADGDQFQFMMRGPLADGHLSETIGGKLVAPLMGAFESSDGASTFSNVNPLDSIFMAPDHTAFFNVIPVSPGETVWRTTWLVDADAEPGTDYDVDELAEFYREINAEDHPIWESTFAGATSRGHRPGLYTPQEGLISSFVQWYIGRLRDQVEVPVALSR